MTEATDFRSSDYDTVASKSNIVPSDHQLTYFDGQTVRFEVPQIFGFIDPRQTYLKFKVEVKDAPTICRFSNKCGIHSLIQNLRIMDKNSNLILENIQGYSQLAEKLHYYTENRSIRNKRGLTELVEYTSRDYDGESYDNLPSRNANQSQLFDSYETGSEAQYTNANRGVTATNKCEVAMRLYSGVLGALNTKMFPAMLTQGLRMELDLNTAGQALEAWSSAGVCNDDGSIASDLTESCRFGIMFADSASGAGTDPVTILQLYMEKNPGFNQDVTSLTPPELCPSLLATQQGCAPVRNQLVGAMNLQVGQMIHAFDNTGTLVSVGRVASLVCNSGEDGGNLAFVTVNITPGSATGGTNPQAQTLQGGAGRQQNGTIAPGQGNFNTCFVKRSDIYNTIPKIEITDIELVVKNAQPPSDYVNSLAKQVQTAEGAEYDYFSFSTYRNNVQASESIAQIDLPVSNKFAQSILSLPVPNGLSENLGNNNNKTITDSASQYSFIVNNKLQPTRAVPLSLLSQNPSKAEQIALWESEKALATCKQAVRNLEHQGENFFFGRALARYGGVFEAEGNISLKVDYNGAQSNKLFMSYVGGLRKLKVGTMGSVVMV